MKQLSVYSGLAIFVFLNSIAYSQICNSNQLPSNLQNGLVAFYPFCGSANDASGNGHNGVSNGASLTTDRYGNANSAYFFEGLTNYIRVPHSPTLNLIGDFSISCWFISQDPPDFNTNHTLFAKRDDNGSCCSPDIPWQVAINYQQTVGNLKKPTIPGSDYEDYLPAFKNSCRSLFIRNFHFDKIII